MKLFLSLAAIGAAATLGACGPTPADPPEQNATAAAMPDTDAVKGTGAQTAPDAGATGAVPPASEPAPVP